MDLTLAEIAEITDGRTLSGDGSMRFNSFHYHSSGASPVSFYIALVGQRADGHDFLEACYNAGCRGALVSSELKFNAYRRSLPGMAAVLVVDPIDALAKLGMTIVRRICPKVVGITGSVGKTTTKGMVAAMLSAKYKVGLTPGNLNTEIGLPIALLNLVGDEELLVLEMATRGFGQIAHLCSIAPPDVAVITAIGHSHIECFGDLDGVRRAKIEIIENMAEGGTGILPGDDPALLAMARKLGKPIVTFGDAPSCDFAIKEIVIDGNGVAFTIRHTDELIKYTMKDGSRGDAFNCAAALAVCATLDVPLQVALDSLRNRQEAGMRMEHREGPNSSLLLVDCYNANPESMRNAIEVATASRRQGGKVIAVLGDMLELGETSSDEHTGLGVELAQRGVDILVTYGDEILKTAQAFFAKGGWHYHFDQHKEIARWLNRNAGQNDVILIKGSRGMALEKVLEFLDKAS